MRMSWAAAAAVLVLCGAARADENGGNNGGMPRSGETTIGVGLICDTSEQAARFVSLRAEGSAPEQAMATVNAEAQQPSACGIAAVAFIPDHTMDMKTVDGKLVRIVRINVIAGFNGAGWQRVASTVQYAVIEPKGEAI